jgi:hypothetical protein
MRFQLRGNAAEIAAERTPGLCDKPSSKSSKNAICCCGLAYFVVEREMFRVSRCCASNPGSTCNKRLKHSAGAHGRRGWNLHRRRSHTRLVHVGLIDAAALTDLF